VTRRIGALAVAVGLAAAGSVLPAAGQTNCQTFQATTTRVTNPPTVTPLDAIAFPTTLTPHTQSVVQQAVICPSGARLAPGFMRRRGFPGTPGVFGAPVYYGYPYEYPYGYPYPYGYSYPYDYSYPYAAPSVTGISVPPVSGTAPTDTVRDLATRSAAYDRMLVTVSGTATNVIQTSDAAGRALTAFRLQAQGEAVDVVSWGRLGVTPGEQVRVSGPFYVSSPFQGPGGRPWHNVIEAQTVDR
jgi:hypothetical protein